MLSLNSSCKLPKNAPQPETGLLSLPEGGGGGGAARFCVYFVTVFI